MNIYDYSKFIIFNIFLLLILYCIYFIFYRKKLKNNIKNLEMFENKPNNSTEVTKSNEINTQCEAGTNVVDYCINYKNCCKNTIGNSKCFCDNTFVKKCNTIYSECKKDPALCTNELKGCCVKYNDINIDYTNFNTPVLQEQKNNKICTLSFTKNLINKCLELCHTNDDCKAYSINDVDCILYNNISPLPNKPNVKHKTEYYIKK